MTNERLETLLLAVREILRDEDAEADARCRLASNLIALLGPEEGDPGRAPEFASPSDQPSEPARGRSPRSPSRRGGKKSSKPTRSTKSTSAAKGSPQTDTTIEALRQMGGKATIGEIADYLGIDAEDVKGRKALAMRLWQAKNSGRLTSPEKGTYAIA